MGSYSSRQTGAAGSRLLAVLLGLVAVLAIVFLLVGNPFDDSDSGSGDATREGGDGDLLGQDGAEGAGEGVSAEAQLAGLYGAGDAGAVRLRLKWVATKEPVVGQPVVLRSRRGVELVTIPSDSLGVVLFPQVHPGRGYSLHIRGEGFAEVLIRGVGVRSREISDVGDVFLGEHVVLRGRVVDAAGRPLPGSSVTVHGIERQLMSKGIVFYLAEQAEAVPLPLEESESDEDGFFAFSTLGDGTYSLVARHDGYASEHKTDVVVSKERGAGVLTIVLGDGGRAAGKVSDEDGKPVIGAQVIALKDLGRRGMMSSNPFQREVAITDGKGRYVIDTLVRGSGYRFGVVAEGFAPIYETGVVTVDLDIERDFVLRRGGSITGIVTAKDTGRPVADAKVAVMVGRMGFGGRGGSSNDQAAAVTVQTNADGRFTFASLIPGPVLTAAVRAPGFVTGTFSMWPPPGNAWKPVVAGETEEVTVQLERGGTVTGFVRDAASQEPIQGATVSLLSRASFWVGGSEAITGADGAYEMVGVRPGTYTAVAMADGYGTPELDDEAGRVVVPAEGGTHAKDISLVAAGAIAGVVKDALGEPIAGARVHLRARGGGPGGGPGGGRRGGRGGAFARGIMLAQRPISDLTDESGAFLLEGVGTGVQWVAVAESDEYVNAESKRVTVAVGETKKVEILMLAAGALSGRVVDENGSGVKGVQVRVGRLDEDQARRRDLNGWEADRLLDSRVFVTDERGRFLASDLEPGVALVKASRSGFVTWYRRDARITSGETRENYTISLSKGETLEGRVRDADGRPLARAFVAVTAQATPRGPWSRGNAEAEEDGGETPVTVEPSMSGRTDEEGRYKVEHIPPGTYTVVVWFAPGHKAWARDNDEAAIQRDVTVPARGIEFRLNRAEAPVMPGGGGGRGGR